MRKYGPGGAVKKEGGIGSYHDTSVAAERF